MYDKEHGINIKKNSKNKGLSYTRNKGIRLSRGDYLCFVDSDDYIPSNFVTELLKSLHEHKAEISVCDIKLIANNNEKVINCGKMKEEIINNPLAASACNKMFKKNVIINEKFPEGKINEDIGVIIPLLANSKISYTNLTHYNYVQRENSTQNISLSKRRFDVFDGVELALSKLKSDNFQDGLIFNQLILFHLYVLTKERNLFARYKWLKIYHIKMKQYSIKDNLFYKKFIDEKNKFLGIYYKIISILNEKGLIILENIVIEIYHICKKIDNWRKR